MILFQSAEKSLTIGKVALEYLGFLPFVLTFGALGFRLLRSRKAVATADEVGSVFVIARRGAAWVGLFGALLILINYVVTAAVNAGSLSTIAALANAGQKAHVRAVIGLLLIIGFALAARGVRGAWAATTIVALAFAFRDIVTGPWTRLVNPLHEVAAGLWLGTLFVIVVAGLPAILGSGASRDQRAALVSDLVARFSPLALFASALLGLTGVVTSWLHLKYVAALWTTPYGYALDAKLVLVLIVVSLGAWNWRRLTPTLGTDGATLALRRSATIELVFAGVVLLVTAVLVSMPSPKLP